jgi:ribosome-binding factor A
VRAVRAAGFPVGVFMSSRKVSRQDFQSACAQPDPEDGLDPRRFLRESRPHVANRKALQLCSQVARLISSILAGECGDEVLSDLAVESVVPAPNASRLLVTVYLTTRASEVTAEEVQAHLQQARGLLRSEVAAGIHRKRAPDLSFRVIQRSHE